MATEVRKNVSIKKNSTIYYILTGTIRTKIRIFSGTRTLKVKETYPSNSVEYSIYNGVDPVIQLVIDVSWK